MGANACDAVQVYFSFLRGMKLDRFCADHLGPRRTHKNHMLKIKGLKCSARRRRKQIISVYGAQKRSSAALIKQ
jgi:hypothetical protein